MRDWGEDGDDREAGWGEVVAALCAILALIGVVTVIVAIVAWL